jgi:crotonobetainyl-CoA:carnitine CoA-transferase CaiB-like acyl-CoA transferase
MHAVFALLVAMFERDHDGSGHFVECSMVEAALNVTAEQVAEFTAYGHLMQRQGNRAPEAAPQGLYACRGHHISDDPQWIALSIATELQWDALLTWLGQPDWAASIGTDLVGRRSAHDEIDERLRLEFSKRDRDGCIDELIAVGVPAARVVDPRTLSEHPQLIARRFFEELDHPVVGCQSTMSVPFRFASVDQWLVSVAPLIGEHNAEVLRELGLDNDEINALAIEKVIGDRPEGL